MNAPLPSCHFPGGDETVRRFREAGDLTLDLFHRDGRVDDYWLGLDPREFALLWRLAEQPGERIAARQLLAEACHVAFEPESEDFAAHMAQVQAKLAAAGLAQLIGTDAEGRHFLIVPPPYDLMPIT
ncbi:MAG: DNA-binding response regulator [Sphingomonadales bacterium]|nr:MAG: DNA-binding response regulator [Sphingomonadales bacterium]